MPEPTARAPGRLLPDVSRGALFFSLLAALAAGFAALFLVQRLLRRVPAYPDFTVGAITWDAATKLQDLASFPAFLAGFLIGGWAMLSVFRHVSAVRSPEYDRTVVTMLIWWLVPVAVGLGGGMGPYPNAASFLIFVGVAGIAITAMTLRLQAARGDATPDQIGAGVLAVMLLGLLPFGIAAVQDRLALNEAFRLGAAPGIGVAIVAVASLYLFKLCRGPATAILRRVPKLLLVAQMGLAPLYLLILPDLYVAGTNHPAIPTTPWLRLLAFGFVAAAVIDVAWRFRRFAGAPRVDFAPLLSPVALFATIVLLRNGASVMPHVPADDYHFGESLLGWWSSLQFGTLPYIDYLPAHGVLVDDFSGFLSLIFYDGTAATLAEADRLAATLALFGTFLAMRWCTGNFGLAYVSTLMFGFIGRKLYFIALVPFYCLWLNMRCDRPRTWLWLWLATALLLVMCVPPQGIIAVAASLPAVALHLHRLKRSSWKRDAAALVVVGALLAFTPLPAMLYGAIRYVAENGPLNQIAYGIPWSWSWSGVAADKTKAVLVIGLDILRMSWAWVPLAAAVLICFLFRRREHRHYVIGVALPILLFVALLTPYAMGRVDTGGVSRPGLLANFAWAALAPLLFAPLLASRGRAVLALTIAFLCAGIGLANVNRGGLRSVLQKNEVGPLWSGAAHGLRNVGTGHVDPQHVDRLARINGFLSSRLAPREAYLDLTGRNAHYMYFDRPPAMAITAPYNMAPRQQQQRAVARLRAGLPRIALLEADNFNHDGGTPALRAHLLYRFVLENYVAELHDGFIYGMARNADMPRQPLSFTIRPLTDPNWVDGVHRMENAIVIRDSVAVRYLRVEDEIVMPDGKPRKIVRVWPEGDAIWFDGERYVPDAKAGREIIAVLDPQRSAQLSARLMERVFAVADLRKVPVAWGRSAGSLEHAMRRVAELDLLHAEPHDLSQELGAYRVIGAAPSLDLMPENLAGKAAGLLQFDLACRGEPNPRLRVSWWGDDMAGPDVSQSFVFTAATGTVIVPLDAYPGWLALKKVKAIRIGLEPPHACQALTMNHASLNQRIDITDGTP